MNPPPWEIPLSYEHLKLHTSPEEIEANKERSREKKMALAQEPRKLDDCKRLAAAVRATADHANIYKRAIQRLADEEIEHRTSLLVGGMKSLKEAKRLLDEYRSDRNTCNARGRVIHTGWSPEYAAKREVQLQVYLRWNHAIEEAVSNNNFKPLESLRYPSFEEVFLTPALNHSVKAHKAKKRC